MRCVVGAFTTLTLTLISGSARADCTKDTDCEGELICDAGACVAAALPAPAPVSSGDAAQRSAAPSTAVPAGEAPVPAPPPKKRSDTSELIAGGVVLVSLGFLSGAGATAVLMKSFECVGQTGSYDEETGEYREPECGSRGAFIVFSVLGISLLGGGLALIVVGVNRQAAPQGGQVTLQPWLGPRVAGASVRLEL
jgi:hypothetical protein